VTFSPTNPRVVQKISNFLAGIPVYSPQIGHFLSDMTVFLTENLKISPRNTSFLPELGHFLPEITLF